MGIDRQQLAAVDVNKAKAEAITRLLERSEQWVVKLKRAVTT